MSYRVCANCDYVINNRILTEWNCPSCDGDKMLNPLDDDRNWDELYKMQKAKSLKELENK